MFVRTLLAPVAIVLGLLSAPTAAEAATPVTVRVNGLQTYGGTPTFTGSTVVAGVTVSGMTCTGLTSGSPIGPTLAALGTYTIDGATCSGGVLSDPDYTISGYIGQRLTVNRAALKVTADDKARDFGDANPPLTYTATGFVNGEDSSLLTGAPTLATGATPSSAPGDYPISILKGSLAASNNYSLTSFVSGKLRVRPKPVTVAVTGVQIYGGSPVFLGSSGVAGVTVSGVTCTRLADGRDIAPSLPVANSYPIDPDSCSGGLLSSASYTIGGYASVRFNVLKAALTVAADDKSRVYGFGNPSLTSTITGFQNGEGASAISGAPTLSTSAVVKSDAGSYPIDIEAGTLAAANYRFVLEDGTFTITKRQLTVAADPATREYGAPDPAFTATFTGFRNGDTAAALSGAPAFSTPATATSDPGDHPLDIAAGSLASPNYTFSGFTSSTLTITRTDATIVTKKMVNGILQATVTYGAASTPVVGSTITFTVGSGDKVACTGVTDAAGKATCTATGANRTAIVLQGYTARFPGTPGVLPGAKKQGIL